MSGVVNTPEVQRSMDPTYEMVVSLWLTDLLETCLKPMHKKCNSKSTLILLCKIRQLSWYIDSGKFQCLFRNKKFKTWSFIHCHGNDTGPKINCSIKCRVVFFCCRALFILREKNWRRIPPESYNMLQTL